MSVYFSMGVSGDRHLLNSTTTTTTTTHFTLILICVALTLLSLADSVYDTPLGPVHERLVVEDSDDLLLFLNKSTLPVDELGTGIFARHNLAQNVILCEPRGPVVKDIDYQASMHELRRNGGKATPPYDRAMQVAAPDGELLHILTTNICGYFCDCVDVTHATYTFDEFVQFFKGDKVIPCYDGFEHNAFALGNGHKIFVVTSKPVRAGEELFYYYGFDYWMPQMRVEINNELYRWVGHVWDTASGEEQMEFLPLSREINPDGSESASASIYMPMPTTQDARARG